MLSALAGFDSAPKRPRLSENLRSVNYGSVGKERVHMNERGIQGRRALVEGGLMTIGQAETFAGLSKSMLYCQIGRASCRERV